MLLLSKSAMKKLSTVIDFDNDTTVMFGKKQKLNWVASQLRRDLSFKICRLSISLNKATIDDLLHANKTVRKCKQRSVCLKFPQLQKPFHLVAFCDASYTNLKDGSSLGGVIAFLKGKDRKNCSYQLVFTKNQRSMSKYTSC